MEITDLRTKIVMAVILAIAAIIIVTIGMSQPVTALEYNETNLTDYQQYPEFTMPIDPLQMAMNNGTGTLTYGYVPTITRVIGLDILMMLSLIQTILLALITLMLFIYVCLYVDRYLSRG